MIATGNAFTGIKLYGNRLGKPFNDVVSAKKVAELEFQDVAWSIVPLYRIPGC